MKQATIVFICVIGASVALGQDSGGKAAPPSAASMPAARDYPTSHPGGGFRAPPLDLEDAEFLANATRRAFRAGLRGQVWSSPYRPSDLAGRRAILNVTLRLQGAAVAEARTPDMELIDGAVAAGSLLVEAAKKKNLPPGAAGDWGIEFEWLGPREDVAAKYDDGGRWTDGLLHAFEPGVEGIGVEFRDKVGLALPSSIIASNYSPDLALQAAEAQAGIQHDDKKHSPEEIHYFRFQGLHLWQPGVGRPPVVLARGEEYVPPSAVTSEGLTAAIRRTGEYLRYRQNRDGWFSEEYLPSADAYSEHNSALVQLRALLGLCTFASWSRSPADLESARRGIQRNFQFLKKLAVVKEPAATSRPLTTTQAGEILFFPGHGSQLGITALMLASMDATPTTTSQPGARSGLVEALLAAQDEEGRLEMTLEGQERAANEDVAAAAWTMIALGKAALVDPSGPLAKEVERVLTRALRHYNTWYEVTNKPQASALLARAWCLAYVISNDARFSDLAFDILDRVAALQTNAANCPWPELHGGISAEQRGFVGADTAEYLLALVDGLLVARRIGDEARIARYTAAVRAGARFLMQLEFSEAGCYYVRSVRDALGGVRLTPWTNAIRVDCCAATVEALIRARAALFGPTPDAP